MFPHRHWLQVTYGLDLARKWGAEARDIMAEHGPDIFGTRVGPGYRLAQSWRLWVPDPDGKWELAGGMRSVPRGGQITGTDAHIIGIDDPIKDEQEADSKGKRDALWAFYQRRLRNRLEPNGKVMLTMSRWNTDDLAARLRDRMDEDEDADRWEVIHLKALAEPTHAELEEAKDTLDDEQFADWLESWRDPIDRKHGESMWPERYTEAHLRQIKASVGIRSWSANFQQEPTDETGGMFPKGAWKWIPEDQLPAKNRLELVRRWDLAGSESSTADWTAGSLLAMDADANVYVIDIRRDRLRPDKKRDFGRNTAAEDEVDWGTGKVRHVLEKEPGASGVDVSDQWLRDVFAGHNARAAPSSAKKEVLAEPFSAQVLAGNVFVVQRRRPDGSWTAPLWYPDFADESEAFPHGGHDDMIDTASKAYLDLVKLWETRRKRKIRTTSVAGQSLPGR
jgi:predicted phage terminase large subunit-like protein